MVLEGTAAKAIFSKLFDASAADKVVREGLGKINAQKSLAATGWTIDDLQITKRRVGGANFALFETWQNPDPTGNSLQKTIRGVVDSIKRIITPNGGAPIQL